MKVKVGKYSEMWDAHRCELEDGSTEYIDVLVDGGAGDIGPDEMQGKIIECDRTTPFVSIAHDVELIEE